MSECLGRAFIFSGRPDPTWRIEQEQARRLEAVWDELAPFVGQRPAGPPLGYRGCSMVCGLKQEYTAFGGAVTKRVSGVAEVREDPARRFEKLLLATAPKGLLPEGLPS